MPYNPTDALTDMAEVRAIIDGIHPAQQHKVLDHIDPYAQVWIERSPFLIMATVGKDGRVDTSPKGDPAGFVRVLDSQTLALPDRPGNHRFDSFQSGTRSCASVAKRKSSAICRCVKAWRSSRASRILLS